MSRLRWLEPQGRRAVLRGVLVALVGIGVLAAAMVPVRAQLSVATAALVLVVPVVAGVALGGFAAGVVASAAGFLAYDLLFIPPYGTLAVGAAQNWVALGVYLAVVLLVARLVSFLQEARRRAQRHEQETRRLYHLAERLLADQPLASTLEQVLSTVEQAFDAPWAAVLLPGDRGLEVAALTGRPDERELAEVASSQGRPYHLGTAGPGPQGPVTVALSAKGRPVGLLALPGLALTDHGWDLLGAYAAQAALAIERSQLRDAAWRAEVLEAADRWQKALLGAVSHDLRTPLATIKTAVSTLRTEEVPLDAGARGELLALVESQADALTRLVTNLLDLGRIESGALRLDRHPTAVEDLVGAAVTAGGTGLERCRVVIDVPEGIPPVDVDELLVVQSLVNLLENAARHSPPQAPVEVAARCVGEAVELAVRDRGPGVPEVDRQRIFEAWSTSLRSGRAGLGLAIARAFVEAHGGRLTLTSPPGGGACFALRLPVAEEHATTTATTQGALG